MQPLTWRTSSYSGAPNNECVEVATTPDRVHVRDTKDRALPAFSVPASAWAPFTTALTDGPLGRRP
ncbi:DUF397 domain-containing protein [Streptomyces clavuligerus]|uniref:DUF397 domain-containing protein n=1 Tax=Streptomyces clavuligerus TaxID=1901 RepID=UPI00020D9334|nr:DUF397 domain-containing protein [Streptomyces clavuligerus]